MMMSEKKYNELKVDGFGFLLLYHFFELPSFMTLLRCQTSGMVSSTAEEICRSC